MFSHRRIVFTLILLPLLLISSRMSFGQETSADDQQQTDSDAELFRKLEGDVQQVISKGFVRNRLDLAHKAERQLTKILYLYPDTPLRDQVDENLSQVREVLGTHNLLIARFYLNRYNDGSGGVEAVESRLSQIVREYPRFSQMDEVLFLLGKVYRRIERLEDAANYFWKLVCEHPTSEKVHEAYEQLSEIGFDAAKGCDNLKP